MKKAVKEMSKDANGLKKSSLVNFDQMKKIFFIQIYKVIFFIIQLVMKIAVDVDHCTFLGRRRASRSTAGSPFHHPLVVRFDVSAPIKLNFSKTIKHVDPL